MAVELYAPWQPDARTLCRLHDELAVEPGLGLPIGLVNCAKEEKLCANFHILRFPCFFLGGLKMEPNGVIHRDWVPYFGRREVGDLIYAFQRKYPDFSVPVDMNVINRFAHDASRTCLLPRSLLTRISFHAILCRRMIHTQKSCSLIGSMTN